MLFICRTGLLLFCVLFAAEVSQGQNSKQDEPADRERVPTIAEFAPESMLRAKQTLLNSAKFSVVDIHGHFGTRLKGDKEALKKYVGVMDRHNIALSVSLDARLGEEDRHLNFLKDYLNRFIVFCHIDFLGTGDKQDPKTHACNQPGFARQVCLQLEAARKKGVVGLKFFKSFGLRHRNADGSLIRIDDPRFDPIWECCAKLKMPVLIHTGDPAAFFEPITPKNERFEELSRHPDWSFFGEGFPSRNELLDARNNVIRKHPKTTFVGAHMGGSPEGTQCGCEVAGRITESRCRIFFANR